MKPKQKNTAKTGKAKTRSDSSEKSEERFLSAFENMLEGVQMLGHDWRYLYLNPAAEVHNRRPNQELLGNRYMDMWPGIEDTHVFSVIKHCLEERDTAQLENRFVYPDGEIGWFRLSIQPISEGVLILSFDITARVRAEKQSIQMKRLYAALSQVNQTIVRVKNQHELFESICRVAVDFAEFPLAWIGLLDDESGELSPVAVHTSGQNKLPFQRINIKEAPYKEGLIGLSFQSGLAQFSNDIQVDARMAHWHETAVKDDYHSAAAVPFRKNGKIMGMLNLYAADYDFFLEEAEQSLLKEMGMDISFALDTMESEKLMRQWADAFEHCSHGIAIGLPSGRLLTCNPAFARAHGAAIREISSMPILDMYAAQDHEQIKQHIAQADRRGSVKFEAQKIRKDGSTYPVEMDLVSVRDESGKLLYRVATQQDISERRQAEKEILSLSRFPTENPNPILRVARDGRILYANHAGVRLLHSWERQIGQQVPDEWQEYVAEVLALEQNKEIEIESAGRTFSYYLAPILESGYVNIYGLDITNRKRAERLLIAFNRSAEAMAGASTPDEVFSAASSQLKAASLECVVLPLNDSGERYVARYLSHAPELLHSLEHLTGIKHEDFAFTADRLEIFQKIRLENRALLVKDAEPLVRQVLPKPLKALAPLMVKALHLPRYIAAPMIVDNVFVGVFAVQAEDLTEEDIPTITAFAHHVANALRKAELFQQTQNDITNRKRAEERIQRQLQRLNGLRAIDTAISSSFDIHVTLDIVLQQVMLQLGADAAAILFFNTHENTIEYAASRGFHSNILYQVQLKLSEGFAGRVVRERKTMYIPALPKTGSKLAEILQSANEDFVDYYGTPLISKDGIKGVLEIYHRVPLDPDPEWLDFLETLAGQAAIAIDNAQLFDSLQRSNAELEQRVMERTAELNHTNAELERANLAKDEFLAAMSHELRTPLNSILGLSESLLEARRGSLNEHQQKSLQIIGASGHHLLDLINDILDLSKIEAGKLDYYPQPVSIDELCRSSLAFVKAQAAKKSIAVNYDNQGALEEIVADPRRLKQILVNLLTNAVKFTPDHGTVTLQVNTQLEQEIIQFSVIDTGIGIALEDMQKLFQPFVQVDSDLNRQYEGTGLGLALVQKLTDLHGGSVQVESEVGKGSRFTINLPWMKDMVVERSVESSSRVETAQQIGQPSDADAHNTKCKVLLAEDNVANILTISEYLESHGYEVTVAHDGLEVLEKAAVIPPDVILMDIQMPAMDGLEATRRLRTDPRFATTPIIALTALAMPGDRERCLEAGASEYMSKPVSLKALVRTIEIMRKAGKDATD